MEITVRQATLDDMEMLVQWRMAVLREVFCISPDEPVSTLEQENRSYYQSAIPSSTHIACFACSDGQIVGCGGVCLHRELPSPDNPGGRCAYLMNIYTAPPFRGQGVGRQVVEWLIQQARQRGITKIYLETSCQARPLYKALGFADMHGYMMLGTKY